MTLPPTPFPAVETAEGAVIAPLSTLPSTAGISFEVWKRIKSNEYSRAYNVANREKIKARKAAYREANLERIKASKAARYARNLENERAKGRAYRLANLKKVRARNAAHQTAYRAAKSGEDRARDVAYQVAYRKANQEKIRLTQTKYVQHRLKIDPAFRLAHGLRVRMRRAFKSQRAEKTKATFKLVGCTKEELRQHLASQFREGMTLENHGKVWHIDHIRPCASFDLSDPNQAILCFHYSNLQPLFVDENRRKGDRWEPTEIRPLAA